jgi:thioredoxin-like negative regulator of GroEL
LVDLDANTTHDVLVILRVADKYLVEGNTVKAEELFDRALRLDPTNIHARAGLARCQIECGALAQAKLTLGRAPLTAQSEAPIVAVTKLIALLEFANQDVNPTNDLDKILSSGDKYLVEGNSIKAIGLFERALGIDRANTHACAGIARCQIDSGAIIQAKRTLEKMLNTGQETEAITAVGRLIAIIESGAGEDALQNSTLSIKAKLRSEEIVGINALASKEREKGPWLCIGRRD